MNQPLSKTHLVALQQDTVRREWLKLLHEQGNRQCVGLFKDHRVEVHGRYVKIEALPLGRVCAMALLGEITEGPRWYGGDRTPRVSLLAIGAKAGLSVPQVRQIVAMNDGSLCSVTGRKMRPHAFRQIAQSVERWFA